MKIINRIILLCSLLSLTAFAGGGSTGGSGGDLYVDPISAITEAMKTQGKDNHYFVIPDHTFIDLVGKITTDESDPLEGYFKFVPEGIVIKDGSALIEAAHQNGSKIFFVGASQYQKLENPKKYFDSLEINSEAIKLIKDFSSNK